MYFTSKNKGDCCGCSACVHSCPVAAIKFSEDEEGFNYPKIDTQLCINCGLCEKICPITNPNYCNNENPTIIGAYLKNAEQRQQSSSGGAFYAIARFIIEKGGKIYGATIDDKHIVYHKGVSTLADLKYLRGSKYVQSDIRDIYKEIKKDLSEHKWVYFTGTGCQVAGLKAFLRKKYETLITTDLVCHGVPSQKMFNWHLSYLEKEYNGKIYNYTFRDNNGWGGCESFYLKRKGQPIKKIKNNSYDLSPYLYSFMYGFTHRYSCYTCPFAKIPRQGDITLADFWGCKEFFPQADVSKGVSLVVLNTEKAFDIWNSVSDKFVKFHTTISDASKYNGNLIGTKDINPQRRIIYHLIETKGYRSVAKSMFRSPVYNKMKLIQFIDNIGLLPVLRTIKHFFKL